jgi:hypothetical protein
MPQKKYEQNAGAGDQDQQEQIWLLRYCLTTIADATFVISGHCYTGHHSRRCHHHQDLTIPIHPPLSRNRLQPKGCSVAVARISYLEITRLGIIKKKRPDLSQHDLQSSRDMEQCVREG